MPMTPLQVKFHRLIRATKTFDDSYYARRYPELVVQHPDLLEHYILIGERQGRSPNLFFDPVWYRSQKPKVRGDDSLLAHYLTVGDRDGLQPTPGFDPPFVRAALGNEREPALVGFLRARTMGKLVNPSRFFDYGYYYRAYPDIAQARIDGFWHFVNLGADEGRIPAKDFSWFLLRERYQLTGKNSEAFRELMLRWRHLTSNAAAPEQLPSVVLLQEELRGVHRQSSYYEAQQPPPPPGVKRSADVYAFYLTQFHRVRENDAWWGEGFTEWHNVVRGVPRFSGHYQPRVPSALGFYDLDDPRVMPRQVALAKQAGLAGFAFYYYHFGDQRLLERPLDRFIDDKGLDVGFFLIWANETWSRRWDGSESEILLEQKYPPDMPEKLAKDLVRYFADPRYRRIDGRPLLVIYRVSSIPDAKNWLRGLRAAFARHGEEPLIYLSQTFEDRDPGPYGIDGAMEFPPHKHSASLRLYQPSKPFGADPLLRVWDYDAFVDVSLADPHPEYPMIRTCLPSWDNDSRRQGASSIIHGSTPDRFRRWLDALVSRAEKREDGPNIVCINAWNEWGEGAYLEPDRHFGYAYLNAVQSVLRPEEADNVRRIVLVGHDAFAAGSQRLLLNLGNTLRNEFGVQVVFVLLRSDPGYEALVEQYQSIAETILVHGDLDGVAHQLARRGFHHAIVNSAASAAALEPLLEAEFAIIQLIHELPAVFAQLGAGPLLGAAAPKLERVIVATQAISDMLVGAGVPVGRIGQLPQGQYRPVVRLDRSNAREQLLGSADDRPMVVALGYGDRRKGLDLFVAACDALLEAETPMLFVWQGDWDPQLAASLADRAEILIAAGVLRHLPDAPDIDTVLNAGDVYFLPSREDPLPSVAIEAWSVGLPVVAIRGTGGIADLIAGNAELGEIVDGEGIEALTAAIQAALDGGRAPERARWARETFDWPTYVRALLGTLYAAPSVDVAIVGHNHGRFAEARVQSLVRQTLPLHRIAYHDIASTDGSPAAIRAVARRAGARFVAEPPNKGRLFETWSAIARSSDAEFLHLAEGDDWIAPTMIERCVAALREAPQAAYAFVAVEWIDEHDVIIADHRYYPQGVIGDSLADGLPVTPETVLTSQMMVKNPVLTVSSVVWRRTALLALLDDNAADFEKLDFAFDWLLYLRAARAGWSACFVPELLCRHRQHAASFATRDDTSRHATEISRIYAMEQAEALDADRAAYLETLR